MYDLNLLKQAEDQELILNDSPESFLKKYARGRCALFTGNKGVEANGALKEFFAAVPQAAHFSGIEAEPETGTVERMAEFLNEGNFDTVFALGGGSVLDAAKAAYLVSQSKLSLHELFGVNMYSARFPGKTLKRIIALLRGKIGIPSLL